MSGSLSANGSAGEVDETENGAATGGGSAPDADAATADDGADGAEGAGEHYTFDDVSVVMGTYNEEEAIATVLEDVDEVTGGAPRSSASTAPRTGRRRSPASTARR